MPPAARLRGPASDQGSDDMVAKTMPKTTTATAEASSKTAFPSPSTISNATVFVSVLAGRLKRGDIDFFLCSVAAGIFRFTASTVLRQRQQILSRFAPRPGLVALRQTFVHRCQLLDVRIRKSLCRLAEVGAG